MGGLGNFPYTVILDENGIILATFVEKLHYEDLQAVIEDAFWLDFTFFICYNKGRICEEAYRFAKFNEYVKWEMIDRLRF